MPFVKNNSNYSGLYYSDSFLIRINENYKYLYVDECDMNDFEAQNIKINEDYYFVFMHEYWHYFINLSTFTRLRDIHLIRNISALFSHTLINTQNGKSSGNKELSKNDKKKLLDLMRLKEIYSGDSIPEDLINSDIKIKDFFITEIISTFYNDVYLDSRKIEISKIVLSLKILTNDNKKLNSKITLGSTAIEESLANIIDSFFDKKGKESVYNPDYIIYLILEKLSLHYFNYILTKYELSCLATLSLMSNDSPYSLIDFFETYRHYRNNLFYSVEKSLQLLSQKITEPFKKIADLVYQDIDDLANIHKERGAIEEAMTQILSLIKFLFNKRIENPLFDLDFIKYDKLDLNILEALFNIVISCDIIQEIKNKNPSKLKKDLYFTFDLATKSLTSDYKRSAALGILNCQQYFVTSHLCEKGFKTTEELEMVIENDLDSVKSMCPFFTCCSAEPRIKESSNCQFYPWRNFVKKDKMNCWFVSGIKTLYGLIKPMSTAAKRCANRSRDR